MSTISDDDHDLFRKAVANVRPLKMAGRVSVPRTSTSVRKKTHIEAETVSLTEPSFPNITSEEAVNFFRPGVRRDRVFKKPQITASLDLHGETRESAKIILAQFIQRCAKQRHRYVRIVHGKGHSAILKNQICHWLPQFPEVLGFQSASPRDGGTGAVYVLLKLQREAL